MSLKKGFQKAARELNEAGNNNQKSQLSDIEAVQIKALMGMIGNQSDEYNVTVSLNEGNGKLELSLLDKATSVTIKERLSIWSAELFVKEALGCGAFVNIDGHTGDFEKCDVPYEHHRFAFFTLLGDHDTDRKYYDVTASRSFKNGPQDTLYEAGEALFEELGARLSLIHI